MSNDDDLVFYIAFVWALFSTKKYLYFAYISTKHVVGTH